MFLLPPYPHSHSFPLSKTNKHPLVRIFKKEKMVIGLCVLKTDRAAFPSVSHSLLSNFTKFISKQVLPILFS